MSDPKSNDCDDVEITPEMIEAGLVAYERWSRFADAPLEGKKRNFFFKQQARA